MVKPNTNRADRQCAAIVIGFMALVAVLAGVSLGHVAFWDDEAYVAVTARTLLSTGHLSYWDGRNIYLPRNGVGFAGTLTPSLPPLDVLLCAASFRCLGFSETAARLPFVLLAVLTVPVFASLVRRRFPSTLAPLVYSLAALCLSCAFLLNARTCRYNMAALFLATLTYWAYERATETMRARWYVAFVAASVGLFYASYLACAAFLAALALTHLALRAKSTSPREWAMQGASALAIAALTVPYALSHSVFAFTYDGPRAPWLPEHLTLVWWNLRDMNLWNVLPWTAVLALIAIVTASRKTAEGHAFRGVVAMWALPLVAYTIFIGLLSPQQTALTTIADIRYLVPALPLAAALSGLVLWQAHRRSLVLGVGVTVLLLSTNVGTLLPSPFAGAAPFTNKARILLPSYLAEVTHPYPTSTSEVVRLLRTEAKPNDTVVTVPDYFEPPIIAALGDRIRITGQLDRRTTPVPERLVRDLGAPLYREETFPDWIIVYGSPLEAADVLDYYGRAHIENGRWVRRQYTPYRRLSVYGGQGQRPELPWHRFGMETYDSIAAGVVVYKPLPPIPVKDR